MGIYKQYLISGTQLSIFLRKTNSIAQHPASLVKQQNEKTGTVNSNFE